MSLTGEHCEIAQSQDPQQPKQLGTRKHTNTVVSEHDTGTQQVSIHMFVHHYSECASQVGM